MTNISRHCQVSPGRQNHPQLRTTDLEKVYITSGVILFPRTYPSKIESSVIRENESFHLFQVLSLPNHWSPTSRLRHLPGMHSGPAVEGRGWRWSPAGGISGVLGRSSGWSACTPCPELSEGIGQSCIGAWLPRAEGEPKHFWEPAACHFYVTHHEM